MAFGCNVAGCPSCARARTSATPPVSVPIGKVVGELSLNIRVIGARRHGARFWLAAQVMKLAAGIAGTQCEISIGRPAGTS